MRARVIEEMPELAEELREVELVPPARTFAERASIDLGGRTVDVRYLGRGHTDNDVVAVVGNVVFAGDLVEQGAPPSFGDSFPLEWPKTGERLLEVVTGPVVPGHGDVVDAAFVRTQLEEIREAARVAKEGWAFGAEMIKVCRTMPFPEPVARECIRRAWAQLEGAAP
jgi:glyoxylase-like metal-dependent hydrolase (beta-lactamase superfamily II)